VATKITANTASMLNVLIKFCFERKKINVKKIKTNNPAIAATIETRLNDNAIAVNERIAAAA
jgi:hypothetical protein